MALFRVRVSIATPEGASFMAADDIEEFADIVDMTRAESRTLYGELSAAQKAGRIADFDIDDAAVFSLDTWLSANRDLIGESK